MTTTRAARLERQITVVAVVLPFLGFLAALWLLWGGAVTGLDLAILAVMYVARRLRRDDRLPPPASPTAPSRPSHGCARRSPSSARCRSRARSSTGSPTTASTTPSPTRRATRTARTRTTAQGWRGVLTGLWHSHMGWLFDGERTSARRFAPDLRKDPLIRWIDSCSRSGRCSASRSRSLAGFVALRRSARRRPDRVRVGRPRARLPAAPRDVERQLDLPHVRQAAVRDRGREPQQLGRRARLARRGLAPHATTPSRRRRARPPARASSTRPTR